MYKDCIYILSSVLHAFSDQIGVKFQFFSGQDCLNKIMEQQNIEPKIKELDCNIFPFGHNYFFRRMFAGDCSCRKCVSVQNNGVKGNSNKIYIFKENLLWFVDSNGYYSSSESKFLSYNNNQGYGPDKTNFQEKRALENALFLGHILNRIVILPKFHCYKGSNYLYPQNLEGNLHYAAHVHFDIKKLDNVFNGKYREHVFLDNPKVPKSIKNSLSPIIAWKFGKPSSETSLAKTFPFEQMSKKSQHVWFDLSSTPVKTETLKAWLETFSDYSVLRFQDLYGNIVDLDSDPEFKRKLKDGVRVHW